MPRPCTICVSPSRVAIDKALIDGRTLRNITAQYGFSIATIQRHKVGHLSQLVADAVVTKQVKDQTAHLRRYAGRAADQKEAGNLDVLGHIAGQLERVAKLSDAVDRWLQDPDDPTQYTIDPRADEIQVIYYDATEERRKRAKLSTLLAAVQSGNPRIMPESGETKTADPRDLLGKLSDSMKGQLALLMAVLEKVYNAQAIEAYEQAVLDAVEEVDPEVKERILENLRRRQPARRLTSG